MGILKTDWFSAEFTRHKEICQASLYFNHKFAFYHCFIPICLFLFLPRGHMAIFSYKENMLLIRTFQKPSKERIRIIVKKYLL